MPFQHSTRIASHPISGLGGLMERSMCKEGGIPLICFPYSEFVKFDGFPIISKNKHADQGGGGGGGDADEEDEDEWMKGASKFRAKENYVDDKWVIEQAKSQMESTNNMIYPQYLRARAERVINCSPSPRRRTPSPPPQPRIWYAKPLKQMPPHFTAQQAIREEGAIILDTQRRTADIDYHNELELMDSIDTQLATLRRREAEVDLERRRLGCYHKIALRQLLMNCTDAVSRHFGEDPKSDNVWSKVYYDNVNEIARRDGELGLGEFDSWIKPANPFYNDLNSAAHNFTDDTYVEAIKAVGGSHDDQAKWMQIYDFVRRARATLSATPSPSPGGYYGRPTPPPTPSPPPPQKRFCPSPDVNAHAPARHTPRPYTKLGPPVSPWKSPTANTNAPRAPTPTYSYTSSPMTTTPPLVPKLPPRPSTRYTANSPYNRNRP